MYKRLGTQPLHACMAAAVRIEDSGREYKTYRGLRADLEPPELRDRPGRSIHLFLGQNDWTSLSGHLNPDGTYAGTLAMKNGGATWQGLMSQVRGFWLGGEGEGGGVHWANIACLQCPNCQAWDSAGAARPCICQAGCVSGAQRAA